jgi:Rrf2 family protein
MKLITRETDYAVRALLYMAQSGKEVVSVNELVKESAIPRAFLRRLLQELGKAGILEPRKGKGGGFTLAEPVNKIKITDLMEIFQGGTDITQCMFKQKICPNRSACPLRKKIKDIEDFVARKLGNITIASLLKVKA